MREIKCSNCGEDCGGDCITKVDFDQLIKEGNIVEALRVFAKEGYENGCFGHTRKQLVEHSAETINKQQEEIYHLKKNLSKSSFNIWSKQSNVNTRNKDAIKLLKHMNMAIDGIWGFACDNDYLFSTTNASSNAEDEYKRIEASIGIDLLELAGKLEVMRSMVFGDSLNWGIVLESLEVE